MKRVTALTASILAGLVWVGGVRLDAEAPGGQGGASIRVTAPLVGGQSVTVPAPDRPTVLLFIKADQPTSHQMLRQIPAIVKDAATAQTILVVSGQQAVQHARGLAESYKYPWPVAVDSDYSLSGKINVHVWPTTVVVSASGERIAHMPGVSKAYADHLEAYLARAAGSIDGEQLTARLSSHSVVGDSPDAAAGRHLQVAQRLVEKGRMAEARVEFNAAYTLNPKDPSVQMALARGLMSLGQTREALLVLERIPSGQAPAFEVSLLRAKGLIARQRWDQAKEIVPTLVKLNPASSEARYLMGLIHQHEGDTAQAAEAFRAAFEVAQPGAMVPAGSRE